MQIKTKIPSITGRPLVFLVGFTLLIGTSTASGQISAFETPRLSLALAGPSCPPSLTASQAKEADKLLTEITQAPTVEQARHVALAPTNTALGALGTARTLLPFSQDLREAQTRLTDAQTRITNAKTQLEVADEFSGMMLAGLDDDRAVRLGVGKHGCNYSTGETIAIVVGLILGIIPGLILMVVLC